MTKEEWWPNDEQKNDMAFYWDCVREDVEKMILEILLQSSPILPIVLAGLTVYFALKAQKERKNKTKGDF